MIRRVIGFVITAIAIVSFLLAGSGLVTEGPLISAGLSLGLLLVICAICMMIYGLVTSKRTV